MNATSTTNSTYVRYMNVVGVDDATKKLITMFGGAKSAKFQITVRHKDYGLIETKDQNLDVSSSVTSYSNYGTVKTDKFIQISFNDGLGS